MSTTTTTKTSTISTTTTTSLFAIVNSLWQKSLIIHSSSNDTTCSIEKGVWQVKSIALDGAVMVVTLEAYVELYQKWLFLGHLGRLPRMGKSGGPSFTWRLMGLGNSTYAVQSSVMNNRNLSYLSLNEQFELQFANSSDTENARWLIQGLQSRL